MKDFWLKFGCFLTGYNYGIVRNSSEATAKAVKKYLSALLIIATLWGFIGFAFTQRYLHGDYITSLLGGLLMMFIIIQVERQIILSVGKNNWAFGFRVAIGVVMAIIGSVILDQIIFKDDVEKNKMESVQLEVNRILPIKTQELSLQIQQLDNAIQSKEQERTNLLNEISQRPTITSITTSVQKQKNEETGKMEIIGNQINSQSIPNPKAELIPKVDEQLKNLRDQKNKKEDEILNARQVLEDELNSKVGFLDELKILFSILLSSPIAFFIWLLLFSFFLAIELFVLVSKYGDSKNDYDKTVLHQMDIRIKMLEKLTEQNKSYAS